MSGGGALVGDVVDVLCLANSRKLGGRCVAGLRLDTEAWIRPVGAGEGGTLYAVDYFLPAAGRDTRLLDLVRMRVVELRPLSCQPENAVVQTPWEYRGCIEARNAAPVLEPLSRQRGDLISRGTDRIPEREILQEPMRQSLCIVEPARIEWVATRSIVGRRQARCRFDIDARPPGDHEWQFDLVVTDPTVEQRLKASEERTYPADAFDLGDGDRIFLTLSLGEVFGGYHYKLVVAVMLTS